MAIIYVFILLLLAVFVHAHSYAMVCFNNRDVTNLCQSYFGYYCTSHGRIQFRTEADQCSRECNCVDLFPKPNCMAKLISGRMSCWRDLDDQDQDATPPVWTPLAEDLKSLSEQPPSETLLEEVGRHDTINDDITSVHDSADVLDVDEQGTYEQAAEMRFVKEQEIKDRIDALKCSERSAHSKSYIHGDKAERDYNLKTGGTDLKVNDHTCDVNVVTPLNWVNAKPASFTKLPPRSTASASSSAIFVPAPGSIIASKGGRAPTGTIRALVIAVCATVVVWYL